MRDFLCAHQQINRAAHECVGHVEADDVWRELPTWQARSRLCVAVHHKFEMLICGIYVPVVTGAEFNAVGWMDRTSLNRYLFPFTIN